MTRAFAKHHQIFSRSLNFTGLFMSSCFGFLKSVWESIHVLLFLMMMFDSRTCSIISRILSMWLLSNISCISDLLICMFKLWPEFVLCCGRSYIVLFPINVCHMSLNLKWVGVCWTCILEFMPVRKPVIDFSVSPKVGVFLGILMHDDPKDSKQLEEISQTLLLVQ